MALIKCPECNHQVSDLAEICPNCGLNIQTYLQNKNSEIENKKQKISNEKEEYYSKKYTEVYDSITLPSQPNDNTVKKAKTTFILWSIITIILVFFDIYFLAINKPNFLIIVTIFCASFAAYSRVIKYPDTKYKYECDVDDYRYIIEHPDEYKKKLTEQILANDSQILEYQQQIDNCSIHQAVEAFKYSTHESNARHVPRCPTCGSPNIEKISIGKKITGDFFWGFKSQNVRSQFHCKNCGYKW